MTHNPNAVVLYAGPPVVRSGTASRPTPAPGGWLSGQSTRDRKGNQIGRTLELKGVSLQAAEQNRYLTNSELWEVYRRTPDLAAAINSIVRRVATWDWFIEPTTDSTDERHDEAMTIAETVRRFLSAPNQDGETWQELTTKFLIDTLVFDQGVFELVSNKGGGLAEIVALRGSTVEPVTDQKGRIKAYVQDPALEAGSLSITERVVFTPEEILFFRLNPTTRTNIGHPLIESIVHEVISLLRSSESMMMSLGWDEIPPGILVLAGITGKAAARAKQDMTNLSGEGNKIRILTTADPKASGAHWIEFRRSPKELDMRELVADVRRVIWRVFGVQPVEMGDTQDVNRATAESQVDVSSSHLVTPILELLEAKINTRIIPRLIGDDEKTGLVQFKFNRDAKLTIKEQKEQAETIAKLIERGVMTVNEAREVLKRIPFDDFADIPTVDIDGVPVPLNIVISGAGKVSGFEVEDDPDASTDDDTDDDDDTDPDGSGSSGDDDDGSADGETGGPSADDEAPGETDAEASRMQAAIRSHFGPTVHICGPRCTHDRAADDLPSDWQPEGRFKGYRTLNLTTLGEAVAEYTERVRPMWHEVRDEVTAAFVAAYRDGEIDEDEAANLRQKISTAFDRLEARWILLTDPLYRRAAQIGRDAAVDYSGAPDILDGWETRADTYAQQAYSYLTRADGLLGEVRTFTTEILSAMSQNRAAPSPDGLRAALPDKFGPGIEAAVLSAVVQSGFDVNEYRITNWSGRLIDLSNGVLIAGLNEASTAAATEAGENDGDDGDDEVRTVTEWHVEWVYVGDKATCPTCEREGAAGIRPMSELQAKPGGDTECRANCRCVLVFWTKQEVTDGDAVRLGPTG